MSKTPPTLSGLIKEYQRQLKIRERTFAEIEELARQRHELVESAQEQFKECERLKTLVDWCIRSGESPVEAMLKHTPEQIRQSLKKQNHYPHTLLESQSEWSNHHITSVYANHNHGVTVTGADPDDLVITLDTLNSNMSP